MEYYYPPLEAADPVRQEKRRRRREYNLLGYALFIQLGISVAVTFAATFLAVFWNILMQTLLTGQPPQVSDPYALIPQWLIPVTSLVGAGTANLIAALAFGGKLGLSFRDMFRKKETSLSLVLTGSAVCLGFNYATSFFMQLINQLLSGVHVTLTTPDVNLSYDGVGNAAMLLYVVIVAPLTEELLFRGVIQRTLQRTGRTFAIVVSSLLFAMLHGNALQTVPAFCMGLVLGYVAMRSGSILPSILIHMANNGFAMLMQSLQAEWAVWLELSVAILCMVVSAAAIFRERDRFSLLGERKAPKGSFPLLLSAWSVSVNLGLYFLMSLAFVKISP